MNQRRKTILVVEDIEDNRKLAALNLQRGGFEVVCVIDGADALDYLATHSVPDAILLDLRMPKMDGWEFLARQQNEPAIARIPVVIYTAEPQPGRDVALAPNVVSCVSKTDGSEKLLDAIRMALTSSR
jgi:CheY-like chemotaxis protein